MATSVQGDGHAARTGAGSTGELLAARLAAAIAATFGAKPYDTGTAEAMAGQWARPSKMRTVFA